MKKKELWLALSALGVVVTSNADASERAGVASKVNPAVEQLSKAGSRVLFVGSDIFRNETISTDDSGQTHLMFLDQSSLTIGPNSELVIDQFVYDPKSNSGELSMSAKKGILRFVGGALSKTAGVKINTPVGNLGIRGAVVLVEIDSSGGDTIAHLIYGDELNFTFLNTGETHILKQHEHSMIITADGRVKIVPISSKQLQKIINKLQGPKDGPSTQHQVTLPDNYNGWLRKLATQGAWDRLKYNEGFDAELLSRDIDDLAS